MICIYAAIGLYYAGYCLGTVDDKPLTWLEVAAMFFMFGLLWPYWLVRSVWRAFKPDQKRGQR